MFMPIRQFFSIHWASTCTIWALTLVILLPFLPQHFSTDDWIRITDQQGYIREALSQSRVVNAGLFWILEQLHINIVQHQFVFNILAWAVFSLGITILYRALHQILNKNISKNRSMLVAVVLVLLVFPFAIADLWQYGFVFFPFSLAFLSGCVGVYFFFKNTRWTRWLVLGLCLGVMIGIYQPWIVLFSGLLLAYTGLDARQNIRSKLIQTSGILSLFLVLMVLSVGWVKYGYPHFYPGAVGDPRVTGVVNIVKNLRILLGSLDEYYWANLALGIPGLWLLTFGLSVVLLKSWYERLVFAGICGVTVVFAYAPHLFSALLLMSPRSVATVFSLPLIPILFVLSRSGFVSVAHKILIVIIVVILGVFTVGTHSALALAQTKTNTVDAIVAKTINAQISQYEQDAGIVVQILYFSFDQTPSVCYREIDNCWYSRYFFVRQFAPGISPSEILRRTAPHPMLYAWTSPDKSAELFGNNVDYDIFVPTKQLKFEGESAYLLIN